MDHKKIILILIIILGVSYFPLKHYLLKRTITRMAVEILHNWQNNNLTGNYVYWKDPMQSPPIYGLNSYEIIKTTFEKKEISSVQVYMRLDFPADNLLPSGKIWIMEFYKFPRLGWLVVDFNQENP